MTVGTRRLLVRLLSAKRSRMVVEFAIRATLLSSMWIIVSLAVHFLGRDIGPGKHTSITEVLLVGLIWGIAMAAVGMLTNDFKMWPKTFRSPSVNSGDRPD